MFDVHISDQGQQWTSTDAIFASSGLKYIEDPEAYFLEKFKGIPGFVQLIHDVVYKNKRGEFKRRIVEENSPQYLLWLMLQKDPKDRISSVEAFNRLPSLVW